MEFQLANGFVALVDEDDLHWLAVHSWHANRGGNSGKQYARRTFRNEQGKQSALLMHRAIMNAPSGVMVDHINGNTLDNRKENLRLCTHGENMQNSKVRKHSGTGVRNVRLAKSGYYEAAVRKDKVRYRSTFSTLAKAEAWAIAKRKELHGEFFWSPGEGEPPE